MSTPVTQYITVAVSPDEVEALRAYAKANDRGDITWQGGLKPVNDIVRRMEATLPRPSILDRLVNDYGWTLSMTGTSASQHTGDPWGVRRVYVMEDGTVHINDQVVGAFPREIAMRLALDLVADIRNAYAAAKKETK